MKFAFLEKCPSLTDFTVATLAHASRDPTPTLLPSSLPHLRTLKSHLPSCRASPAARCALATHPVLPLLTPKDLAPVVQMGATITELRIHAHMHFAFPIHKHLLRLEVLGLAYVHPNSSVAPAVSTVELFREVQGMMRQKNETSITELNHTFFDFLEQLGLTEDDRDPQLFFGGGDGMSYNNLLLLKKYLQNHTDPF
ncbi:hypothetical protein B0H13DRAFT_2309585 [Mycena leptocephala]|nr:hypothetical protein B0H13DRAFT_2309585 [Mycena leptocephala]